MKFLAEPYSRGDMPRDFCILVVVEEETPKQKRLG
jgi:hypothetical protein